MAIGLLTLVVMARILGPEGRGLYAVAATLGALGAQFGTLGLHTSNAYFAASKPESLPALTGNTLVIAFGFGGLIAAVLGTIFFLSPGLLFIRGATLLLALLWIPCGLACALLQNLMLGIEDICGYNIVEIANKSLPLILVGLLVLGRSVTVSAVLSTTVLAMAASCVWVVQRLRVRSRIRVQLSRAVFLASIKYAIKAYLAGTFCFLVLRADLFMVQHMLGSEQAGYYSVASSMADYISAIAAVIATILFPRLSALNDLRRKLDLTTKTAKGTAAILIPFLVVAFLVAKPAVSVLLGPAFLPASLPFILLLPGMLFLGMHTVVVQLLNSLGYPKSVVFIWAACTLLNIALNLWVIPHYGIAGASLVSSFSYLLAFVLVLWIVRKTAQTLVLTSSSLETA
jgi:O-antigen/teichoic acid export membrane protein